MAESYSLGPLGLRPLMAGLGIALLGVVLNAAPASASSIHVVATTTGCFGTGCNTCLGSTSSSVWQMDFTGNTFNVTTTDPGGVANNINLGSFHRTGAKHVKRRNRSLA